MRLPILSKQRHRNLRAGIFTRLFLALLLVSLLPLTAFWQLERQRMIDNGELQARQQLELFADRMVRQVDDWMSLNLSVLEVAAQERAMRSMRSAAQRRLILRLAGQLPWAYLIATVDLDGRYVARSDGGGQFGPVDRSLFRKILAGRSEADEVRIARTVHRPVLVMAVPIKRGNGQLVGVLVEAATLDNVTKAVTGARLGQSGHAFLMTRAGWLIADRGISLRHRLRNLSGHPAFRAAQHGDGFYHYAYRGSRKVAVVRHSRFGWIVVTQQKESESLRAVRQANRYAWLLLGLTTAAVAAIAALVASVFARRIGSAARALEQARAQAERANRSKTRFVAAAVHDLMQPLNAARVFCAALRAPVSQDSTRALCDDLDRALSAENDILSSLLDISRLESGNLQVHERAFSVATLLETLGREFDMLARSRGLELRVHSSRLAIRSDEVLLRRILQNFLSNAVRYTRKGGILMGCRRAGGDIRIEVWDTGPGIPREQWRKIFQEFQRLDAGVAPLDGGAGLGLAIAELIGARLNHRIGLRSWVGRGSVFWVQVPRVGHASSPEAGVVAADEAAMNDRPAPRNSVTAGARVWAIEDDSSTRQLMTSLLANWGCVVSAAGSCAQALRHAQEESQAPDLVLLDYQLPDGFGPALVTELQRRWNKETVAVMLVTAERDDSLRAQCVSNGWGFLAKPITAAKLRAAVTHILMRTAAQRAQSI
jgi:signal transduction histidine kinase/CheY-like chemotaxis protein